MCGIGGYIKKGGVLDEADIELIEELSIMLEARGEDAFGFIVIDKDGKVRRLFKLPANASAVWEQLREYIAGLMLGAKGVLLHTRAATVGTPKHNKNNHPFRIGSWYLAHNGGVLKHVQGEYVIRRRAEHVGITDEPETDTYRYLFKPLVKKLSGNGCNVKDAIEHVWRAEDVVGSFWLYNEDMKRLWIFRGERELEYLDLDGAFIFASKGLGIGAVKVKPGTLMELSYDGVLLGIMDVGINVKVDRMR